MQAQKRWISNNLAIFNHDDDDDDDDDVLLPS